MPRTRTTALLAVVLLAACSPQPQSGETADAVEVAAATETATPGAAPPPAEADGPAPPAGEYECYYYGDAYALTTSSLLSLRIHTAREYEAMEERGTFRFDGGTGVLTAETGPLAGRVAHLRESSGKPALVFERDENEVDGKPTLDVSDTWCYHEPR